MIKFWNQLLNETPKLHYKIGIWKIPYCVNFSTAVSVTAVYDRSGINITLLQCTPNPLPGSGWTKVAGRL